VTQKQYITALVVMSASVFFTPAVDELVKVYIVSIVTLVSALFNILFQWQKIREYIVRRLVADVLEELLTREALKEYNDRKKLIDDTSRKVAAER
jgi:hypothetical protein